MLVEKYGFHDLLKPVQIHRLEPPPYAMGWDEAASVNNADTIIAYAKQQAALLKPLLENAVFPVILGGDCSILIGNALACKQVGKFGLFYLDGHTDFMGPGWTWQLSQAAGTKNLPISINSNLIFRKSTYGV